MGSQQGLWAFWEVELKTPEQALLQTCAVWQHACGLACALQVQVQRRETERQAEQRLASFAHISQTEADEKWRMLEYAASDSEVASGVWEKLMKPPQQAAFPASMPCATYLSTLTAGIAGVLSLYCQMAAAV